MNLILAETGSGNWVLIIVLVALFALMIIPTYFRNKKENAKRQEVMGQLKAGDAIMTTAGVFGKIVSMRETTIGRVFVIETGDENHKSYQEIHADAVMGLDTKRDIVLDADGNDITFAEEDKIEEDKIEEEKTTEEVIEEENTEKDKKKTSKSKKSDK